MDIYESLKRKVSQEKQATVEEYSSLAAKYAEQGFDRVTVSELIQVDGCDANLSKKIASAVIDNLPMDYCIESPPTSFSDVKGKVEDLINSPNRIVELESYLAQFASKEYHEIPEQARNAQASMSKNTGRIVAAALEPLVNDLILSNNALSRDEAFVSSGPDQKESLEQDLFGVWPVSLLRHKAGIDKADDKLLKRVDVRVGDDISFI